MLTVVTLLKMKPSPGGELHGERAFWAELGPKYLAAWLTGVRRYVPEPKRVIVMTDSYAAIPVGVTTRQLAIDIDARGFFAKLNMFRPEVSSGKTLYMDLDNVLCGDLSALCSLSPDPLLMTDDRHIPGLPNGSTMLFDAERCRGIWDTYAKRPRQYERDFLPEGEDYGHAYDQAFIAEWLDESGYEVGLLQEHLPLGYMVNAYSELPNCEEWRTARLIFGCGAAKPHRSSHPVFKENWAAS